ncbi:MAG: FtsQ-type POTRA domain-containing protein [Anaerolineales bacterium]|nr:FtsQ-type POTRA domain-containing protein [Anaerolineales bacterium]
MTPNQNLTRAEAVRQRRTQQSTRPKKRKTSGYGVKNLAPITTRGVSAYIVPDRKNPAETRQYAVALNAGQASLRLPSLPKIKIGWRWLSFALVILITWALYTLGTAPQFSVQAAEVQGNVYVNSNEINNILDLQGRSIFTLTPAGIKEQLGRTFPELAEIEVSVNLPNQVIVDVTERQPIIKWQQGDGYTWIDASGIAFRPRADVPGLINVNALAAPPLVAKADDDPFTPAPFITTDMIAALQTLAPFVPEGTAITYDPYYGLGWYDNRGWQVYFGHVTENIALKLRIYQTMVDWLTNRGLKPTLISVAYTNAPFYRLEP